MGYQLVETIEVGSGGAASIEFTGIPQDGVDLQVLLSTRHDSTSSIVEIRFNSESINRSSIRLTGDGTSVYSASQTNIWTRGNRSDATASTFANSQFYVSNYAGATAKSVSSDGVGENNGTLAYAEINAGLWDNTDAITSLMLIPNSGNFVQYSTASLYKITAD
jgi:hypothetical protein